MTARTRLAFVIAVVLPCLTAVYLNVALPRPVWDEALYHLPELARYGPGLPGLTTLREAGAAVGPLFYVLFANLAAPFGTSLLSLRLLILACATANLVLFALLARRAAGERAGALILLLATFPYFLTLSGLFLSEQPALLAGLGAFLLFLRWRERPHAGRLVACLASAAAAVLVRQYFLFLPLGLAAVEVASGAGRRRTGLLLALPALALVPILLLWGGLVPPALQSRHAPGFSLAGLSSFLVWTGLYCLPWLWLRVRRTAPGAWLLLALLALPVAAAAPEPGAGIVRTLFRLLPAGALPVLSGIGAVLGGAVIVVLALGLRRAAPPQRAATILFLALGLLFLASGPLVYERYYLPALPLALIALADDIRPLPALAWSFLVQLPLAVAQLLRLGAK
ncbi:MAG: glycosyltransferase family 39 protein [bacterium]